MALKQANILLLIPNLGPGGAQRVFHDHSIALSAYYNVTECVFNLDDGVAYPTGNPLVDLKVPGGSNIFFKACYFLLRCIRLKQVKKRYNIDVCISHLEGADYINILGKGKEKVVLCIHGSKLHDLNISGFLGIVRKKILMPFLYNRTNRIITVSRDINSELIDGFGVDPDKIQTINNFFDVQKISAQALQPLQNFQALFEENKVVITSGRLTLQKNQAPLLQVFAELIKSHACKLVFLGDGELRDDLVNYSRELGLRTFTVWDTPGATGDYDVYFLGYQQNPFQYINRAAVFAFPSAWEGFPMALCEAMVCGITVITADCPTGPREILAPFSPPNQHIQDPEFAAYGVLMPMLNQRNGEGAVTAWVKTLGRVLEDQKGREEYAVKGRQRMEDFTPDKIIAKWVQTIKELF